MTIPSTFAAGDTVSWQDDVSTLAVGATLSYALRGPGAPVNVAVASNGRASIAAATTATMNTTPADVTWFWQAYVTDVSGRTLAGEGQIRVKANLSAQNANFDGRSQTQKDLDAVRAAITARANSGLVLSYTIGNRNLQRESVKGLLELQSMLEARLRREQLTAKLAAGLGNPAKILVRFGRGRGVRSGD